MMNEIDLSAEFEVWRKEQEAAHEASGCTCREQYFIVNNNTWAARLETQVEWDETCPLHGYNEE